MHGKRCIKEVDLTSEAVTMRLYEARESKARGKASIRLWNDGYRVAPCIAVGLRWH